MEPIETLPKADFEHIATNLKKSFTASTIMLTFTALLIAGILVFYNFADLVAIIAILGCIFVAEAALWWLTFSRVRNFKKNNYLWLSTKLVESVSSHSKKASVYTIAEGIRVKFCDNALVAHKNKDVIVLQIPENDSTSTLYNLAFVKKSVDKE